MHAPDYASEEMLLEYQQPGTEAYDNESDLYWRPMVSPGQPLKFNCWVSFLEEKLFWETLRANKKFAGKKVCEQNDWNITFDSKTENEREMKVQIDLNKYYQQIFSHNKTLNLHCEFRTPNIYEPLNDLLKGNFSKMTIRIFRHSIPLIIYKPS